MDYRFSMDNLFVALILSIIEGITEFLPVSSSGHLILAGSLLNFVGDKASTFEVVIQLGAILAVVLVYRERFFSLCNLRKSRLKDTGCGLHGLFGIFLLLLTTLPACILGLLLHNSIKLYLFRPETVVVALLVGAFFMILIEYLKKTPKYWSLDKITPIVAFGIGCFQCLALWPGFSRSAATIMGGMLLGVERKAAAEYSFIAAVPIMVAATGYDFLKNFHLFSLHDIPFFLTGMFISFLSALVAVKTFIALLAKINLIPFAIYRLFLAPLFYFFAIM